MGNIQDKSMISRAEFLKGVGVAGLAVGSTSFLGACSTNAASGANSSNARSEDLGSDGDGAYVGYGAGFRDTVSAFISIKDGRITSVVPGLQRETTGPGTDALARLSSRIVELQSVNIDTISGATLTSMGFLSAAREALTNAGMLDQFSEPASLTPPVRNDEEYDIVVVGGGGSGMMAAMSAKYPGFDGKLSETKVLVLEKMDVVGGSTRVSGGGVAVPNGVTANNIAGNHKTGADMVKTLTDRSNLEVFAPWDETLSVNAALVERLTDNAGWLWTRVAEFGGPVVTGAVSNSGPFVTLQSRNRVQLIDPEGNPMHDKAYFNEGGYNLATYLRCKVLESGTEIRTGARVIKLNSANGEITGVRVLEGDTEYDISAKKVILSCGGFANNPEMLAELCPEFAGIQSYCGAGNTGDGWELTKEFGLQQVGKGLLGYFGPDKYWGITTALGKGMTPKPNMLVTTEGKRTFSEPDSDYYFAAYYLCAAPGNKMFGICDSDSAMAKVMEEDALTYGRGFKAETLEELASLAGIDAGGLEETVDAYNAAYEAGDAAEFGTPNDKLSPVKTPPFYAYEVVPLTIGTLISHKVDENCQFLNQDNEPIKNLYGTGEMIFGGNVLSRLYMGGMSLFTAMNSGNLAAKHALANL